ncbi:hypothetical protein [Paracoccus aminovorans]|uniref:hypothetical protein n=1 Tax=Paracoccus aminovorans TaxID=34004 RepID=UPI000783130C|nr:hypothetical protein [Paracoccus aminovorans]
MVIIDGQSLGLGHNGTAAERTQEGYRNRPASRMHRGLMRSDAALTMPLHGPLSQGYAADHATGLSFAVPVGNIPACLTFASALDLWRRQLGLPLHRMIVGFNGIGGQSIVQFDHDPLPDPFGTKIRDNHARWLAEMMSVEPTAVPLLYACIQGEADVSQTPEWYRAQAHVSYDAALDDIEAATGVRPPVVVWQTGAYTNGTTTNSGSTLAQLQLVEDYSAAFAGPLYPNFLADNVVHPTLDYQILHCEIAALVWAHREAGQNINLLPLAPIWSGNTVRIPFSVRPGRSLAFEAVDKYAAYGGLTNHGVEATGANITSVTLDGNAVVVTCDGPMTQVQIAMQSQDVSSFADGSLGNYGAHRCDIMESDPEDSLMLPGWKLKRFIPSCRFARP